jgi:hypothetical protein
LFIIIEVLTWERGQPRDFDVSSDGYGNNNDNRLPHLKAELRRMLRDENVHVFRRRPTAEWAAGIPASAIPLRPFFSPMHEDVDDQIFDFALY